MLPRARPLPVIAAWLLTLLLAGPAVGQQELPAGDPAQQLLALDPQTVSPQEQATFRELITSIALDTMPHNYEDKRKWGQTKEVFDGLKVSREGLQIKTKRRWKQVNHGTWKLYRLWLINPEEDFHVTVENVEVHGPLRLSFDLVVDARLGAFARLSQWQLDVQLLSVSIDAEALVRLRVSCEVQLRVDTQGYPPDLVLEPVATDADLVLLDFRLQRISDLKGPLVKELGEELHDRLQEEIEQREVKLLERINRQIEKRRDRLRLSLRRQP